MSLSNDRKHRSNKQRASPPSKREKGIYQEAETIHHKGAPASSSLSQKTLARMQQNSMETQIELNMIVSSYFIGPKFLWVSVKRWKVFITKVWTVEV